MERIEALLKVALRQQAIFIPDVPRPISRTQADGETISFVSELVMLGYTVNEDLLSALQQTPSSTRAMILANIREAKGIHKNWTPLVKNWLEPTHESQADYIMTFFANLFPNDPTITLPCGHFIPEGTFPLERYNGCPYCGTPFGFEALVLQDQGSKKVVLQCWGEAEIQQLFTNLLRSKTALDATQVDSLKILMSLYPLPDTKPAMKETLMLVVDTLLENGAHKKAGSLLTGPNEILRYLWYKHTGNLQLVRPRVIIKRQSKNHQHFAHNRHLGAKVRLAAKEKLQLKYGRETGRMVATWLNDMEQPIEKLCEEMHPKREMWVRFIRALRLSEFSKRKGFENLAKLLDIFYHEKYEVHAADVQQYRLRKDTDHTLALMKKRPGLFARSLFANMLWFGPDDVLTAFAAVMDKVPARLVFTLGMYAETYFDKRATRTVKPLGGVAKNIPANKLLQLFSDEEVIKMQDDVKNLTLELMKDRFSRVKNDNRTIYIDPMLFKIPLSIGDRSENIQDLPSALQGTRFPVEGDKIRLFMQWGEGLPAQHLDMDLSCQIAYDDRVEHCSYYNKHPHGCYHSGDIQTIPDMIGTAEYINIDLDKLREKNAKYVIFTCNAYTHGSLSPNLVVGWMDTKYSMKITDKGVAYDPSCVQHQVRVGSGLTKGLVFGILDITANEIVWMEMPFQGQIVAQLDTRGAESLLRKLYSKLSIGTFLRVKAGAQELTEVAEETLADEAYTAIWARDAAAVTQLFID